LLFNYIYVINPRWSFSTDVLQHTGVAKGSSSVMKILEKVKRNEKA